MNLELIEGLTIGFGIFFFFLFFLRLTLIHKIFYHLKTNYPYFYKEISHRDDIGPFYLISSGKYIFHTFRIMFTERYKLDDWLIKKIKFLKLVSITKNILLLVLSLLFLQIGRLVL